jgi:HSP20 family protein
MTGRNDPFGDIEELFDQFADFGATLSADIPVDVLDREEVVVVLADLPGRESGEIQVRLEDQRTLHIEAPAPAGTDEGQYVVRERPRAEVSRAVRLPAPVSESDTEASYDQGVLRVELGKPSAGDGTEIAVN